MNSLPVAQVSVAQQTNLEILRGVSDMLGLMEKNIAQIETLLEWNLQWVHAAFPGTCEYTKQLLAMSRPRDVLAMQFFLMHLASGQACLHPRVLPAMA
ncbi:hypothetical protein [Cupriavidus necator]|uniref:hypothetical protein n=1 Tax=Cupriavidus necator TaxID=106590 RepID=UPI001E499BDB|nr:hypothetical protein [Cupriavidus necator]